MRRREDLFHLRDSFRAENKPSKIIFLQRGHDEISAPLAPLLTEERGTGRREREVPG